MNQNTIIIENTKVMFKNFSGADGNYGKEDPNFTIVIPDTAQADTLQQMGFNVRVLPPVQEGDPAVPVIKIKVNYRGFPPAVEMITPTSRVMLGADTVGRLDQLQILQADVAFNPYAYPGGNGKLSAYLEKGMFLVQPGLFDDKYAHLPITSA